MAFIAQSLPLYQQLLAIGLAGSTLLCLSCILYGGIIRWGNATAGPAPRPFYPESGFPNLLMQAVAVLYLVLYVAMAASNMSVAEAPGGQDAPIPYMQLLIAEIIQASFSLPLILLLLLQPRPEKPAYMALKLIAAIPAGLLALFAFMALLELSGFNGWLLNVSHCPANQEVVDDFINAGFETRIILAVSAAIIAPIVEECFFRGFLYTTLRHWAGPVAAALASSLFFASIHTALAQMLPLTAVGMVLCLLYERFRSLWAPILFHAAFNFLSLIAIMM